jgi:hypothetical protein
LDRFLILLSFLFFFLRLMAVLRPILLELLGPLGLESHQGPCCAEPGPLGIPARSRVMMMILVAMLDTVFFFLVFLIIV